MGEVAQHLVVGDGKAVGDGIEDALVGLMQQQPIEIGGWGVGAGDRCGSIEQLGGLG